MQQISLNSLGLIAPSSWKHFHENLPTCFLGVVHSYLDGDDEEPKLDDYACGDSVVATKRVSGNPRG